MLNLASLLENSARKYGDREAVVLGDKRLTYAQVNGAANQVANLLVSRGIQPGDKVALSCPNLPYFPIVYYGILKAGATVVPLNVLLRAREVAYHLADFTWGWLNPGFERGEVYRNVAASFSNPIVALFYVAANLALGVHLYHGAWSLFQSLGVNRPGFNPWRRAFAIAFTVITIGGNLSFPIAVQLGIVG